jgi:hypothetical protein
MLCEHRMMNALEALASWVNVCSMALQRSGPHCRCRGGLRCHQCCLEAGSVASPGVYIFTMSVAAACVQSTRQPFTCSPFACMLSRL